MSSILDMLSDVFTQLTENIVVGGLTVFAVSLGFFAIRYLGRRRESLDHARMAAVLKGLHWAGVSREAYTTPPKRDGHEHLVRGMRWLFGGIGVSSALFTYEAVQPANTIIDALRGALAGLVPGAIGLAHLFLSWLCERRHRRESSLRSSRAFYRAATRRA